MVPCYGAAVVLGNGARPKPPQLTRARWAALMPAYEIGTSYTSILERASAAAAATSTISNPTLVSQGASRGCNLA